MSVVGPLPLVDARIDVPPTCVTRFGTRAEPPIPPKDAKSAAQAPLPAPSTVRAVALKGQVLKWAVSIKNAGE